MAELINLNKARKRKAREQAALQAAQNRVKFGRTPAQKQRDENLSAEARRRMDQLKLDDPAR